VNEGARNSAILSFKATLSAFCTAAIGTTVELSLIDIISSLYWVVVDVIVESTFPAHKSMGIIGRRIDMQP
jgi:hypothetical protein